MQLREHILEQNHEESWSAAFRTREEATEYKERRERHLRFKKELEAMGWGNARSVTHSRNGCGERVCKTCQTPLPTTEARNQHLLFDEGCWKDEPGTRRLCACWNCCQTFDSVAQARQHVKSSPNCLAHIRVRFKKPSDIVAKLPSVAASRYRRSIAVLLDIGQEFETLSIKSAPSVARSIYEHLRPIYNEAQLARDNDILSLFGGRPSASHAIEQVATREVDPRTNLDPPTGSMSRQQQATPRQRHSATWTNSSVSPTAHVRIDQSAKVVGSQSNFRDATNRLKWDSKTTRKRKDPKLELTYYYHGTHPYVKVRKPKDATPEPENKTEKSEVLEAKIDQDSIHDSINPIQTEESVSKLETFKANSALDGGQTTSSRQKPTMSSPRPDADTADLRVQLQTLMEQVKLLREKIAALSMSDERSPSVIPAASNTMVSAQDVPMIQDARLGESLSAVRLQHSGDASAEVSLALPQGFGDSPVPTTTTTASWSASDQSSSVEPMRRYGSKSQAMLENVKMKRFIDMKALKPSNEFEEAVQTKFSQEPLLGFDKAAETNVDGQRLVRQIHTQARLMKSSDRSNNDSQNDNNMGAGPSQAPSESPLSKAPSETLGMSEQSLLNELFPEASNYIQPHYSKRNPYPKLNLPNSAPVIRTYQPKEKLSEREKLMQAFERSAEKVTALQLLHCSTELTEADFRRLVPKGRHIEGWSRDGDFYKVIPGRDPLSLERLPFYYLLFKNAEAALRYQNNAVRLHKLSKLHGPHSSLSAIPPPPGFLENGEDVNAALSSYLLTPTSQKLQLNMVVQPYNPALARLIADGGYAPIVPSVNTTGKQIYKVLFYIEGYEPSPYDLYQIFMQDASSRGFAWPFLHEHQSIRRLRDIVDLKTKFLPISSANPRASSITKRKLVEMKDHNPYASFLSQDDGESENADGRDGKFINQTIMNRVYNRWIIEFSEEEGARRFARLWHRKALPMQDSVQHRTWRDLEEVRMCNTEYLW